MIIDAHTHYFEQWCGLKGLSPEEFIEQLNRNNIDKAIVFTMTGFFGNTRQANNEIAELIMRYPNRLYGFATVNPYEGKGARKEIRRAVKELGLKGLKLHPWVQGFSVTGDLMFPIVEECINLDVPLIFHDGTPPYSTPLQIAHLAYLYSDAKIILGHAGLKDMWENALDAARNFSNIWLCVNGTPSLGIETMIREIGSDRIVYGSDAGFGDPGHITYELLKIQNLEIEEKHKRKILGENIMKLLFG